MKLRLDLFVDYFLGIMLIVKFVFLISAVGHIITVKSKNPKIQQHEKMMRDISETTEMIFLFGMSVFLIYYFVPNKKAYVINKETALLLFAYGFVTFVAALKRYHLMPARQFQKSETTPSKSPSTSAGSFPRTSTSTSQ
jgi:hypothetical protein